MNVPQLLNEIGIAAKVAVIVALLPERLPLSILRMRHALCGTQLHKPNELSKCAALRLTHQQVNVFGHQHETVNAHLAKLARRF